MPALPFKLNQDRRHHIPLRQRKVTNWLAYEAGLLSDKAVIAPTQRDRHLQCIAERSRMAWQKASGYNRRAKVEAAIGRWKLVIGDGLRSRTEQRRVTEVNVAVHVLNRMLEFGRPSYVRA
jgi:hypothetical protein